MKKRVVAILMATVVAVGSLAGCGSKGGNGGEASTEEGKVINIYLGMMSSVRDWKLYILKLSQHPKMDLLQH